MDKKQVLKDLIQLFHSDYEKTLANKTVMLPLSVDEYDRKQHTADVESFAIEVSKRLMAEHKGLKIDLDLVSAISFWHDVGHCPYGHKGEEQLNSLLSEDNGEYILNFFSGYKHNILSAAILLLEVNKNVPWELVDGVLKHSSALPSNFNVLRIGNKNLLKLNYIFRTDNFDDEIYSNWKTFINKYHLRMPCSTCVKFKKSKSENSTINESCHLCDYDFKNNKPYYIYAKNENTDIDTNICNYFFINEPLSLEGKIVKISDEIVGLSNDIFHYYYSIRDTSAYEKNVIVITIKKALKNISTYFVLNKNSLGKNMMELIESLALEPSKTNCDRLLTFFLKNVQLTKCFNGCLMYDGDQKLVDSPTLRDPIDKVFNSVKKDIYTIMHHDRRIEDNNKIGSEMLIDCFNYFFSNKQAFFKLDNTNNKEFESYYTKIMNKEFDFDNAIADLNFANELDELKYENLLNAFRRQIVFYLARVNENALKEIYESIKNKSVEFNL